MRPLNMHRRKPLGFRRQRGAVAILLTVAMVALVAMAGLTLDGGHLMLNKSRLQNAVDAAALSGAKTLSQMKGLTRPQAAEQARTAALNTLQINAEADGNGELLRAMGESAQFAIVEFSERIDGGFGPNLTQGGKYVRVTVPAYGLEGFFWRFLDSLGAVELGDKQVAAMAVAGTAPSRPCEVVPLMVCADPTPASGTFWGYRFGQLQVLKMAGGDQSSGNNQNAQDWDVGPGNFHLLRLGSGGAGPMIESGMAGGIDQCTTPGEGLTVDTKPGNMVGPVRKGYNTRFNEGSTTQYRSDYIIKNAGGKDDLEWDSATAKVMLGSGKNSVAVDSSVDGKLYAGGNRLYDYPAYLEDTAACINKSGGSCQDQGAPWRRILKVVIGDCTGTAGGTKPVIVKGYGCFFALQKLQSGGGNKANIFGQFVEACDGDGYAGPNPANDAGPEIIQLYRAYGSPGDDA